VWKQLLSDPETTRLYARGVALAVVFLLGCAAVIVGLFSANLGLIAAGTTMFGLVGIAKA